MDSKTQLKNHVLDLEREPEQKASFQTLRIGHLRRLSEHLRINIRLAEKKGPESNR